MIPIRHAIAVSLSLLLVACGSEEHSDIKEWMQTASKDLRGKVPPLPEVKPFPVVSYEAGDLLDPFNAAKIEPERKPGAAAAGLHPDMERRKEELESYPLEQLKFVGVLQDKKTLFALISVDKKIYRKKVGNYLGQNSGKIMDIRGSFATRSEDTSDNVIKPGVLVLKELVQDPTTSSWVEKERVIELQAPEIK